MKPTFLLGLLLLGVFSAISQQPKSTYQEASSTGHLAMPAKMEFQDSLVDRLRVPAGFKVSIFARDLQNPRMLAVDRQGALLVTRPEQKDVLRIRDIDNDGKGDEISTIAENLDQVHGIAIHDNVLFLADVKAIYSAELSDGHGPLVVKKIAELGGGGQHAKRTLAIGPDEMLYVSVGSTCNVCTEPDEDHARIFQMKLDGTGKKVFATGLRNTIGFDWNHGTGEMWGIDNGADWRGDDQPPEELNKIMSGGNYGWPFCFDNRKPDAEFSGEPKGTTKETYCTQTMPPAITFTAHSAPMTLVFYRGDSFPADYRDSAFATFRGSWNRKPPAGYKVMRVRFANGAPVGTEDFLTGFLAADGKSVFGRPTGLAMSKDGSLFVADDMNGVIYRISCVK